MNKLTEWNEQMIAWKCKVYCLVMLVHSRNLGMNSHSFLLSTLRVSTYPTLTPEGRAKAAKNPRSVKCPKLRMLSK